MEQAHLYDALSSVDARNKHPLILLRSAHFHLHHGLKDLRARALHGLGDVCDKRQQHARTPQPLHHHTAAAAAAAAAHLSESSFGGELERQLVGVDAVSGAVGDEPDTVAHVNKT